MPLDVNDKYISLPELGSSPSLPDVGASHIFARTSGLLHIVGASGQDAVLGSSVFEFGDMLDVQLENAQSGDFFRFESGYWQNSASIRAQYPDAISDVINVRAAVEEEGATLLYINGNWYTKKNYPALIAQSYGINNNGFILPDHDDFIFERISYINYDEEKNRRRWGDSELSNAFHYKMQSDVDFSDHGVYLAHAWCMIQVGDANATSAGGVVPYSELVVQFHILDGDQSIKSYVLYQKQLAAEGAHSFYFSVPFKSDSTVPMSTRQYAFEFSTTNNELIRGWYTTALEKASSSLD